MISSKGLLLVTHEPSFVNTAPGPHIRGNTLRAYSLGDKEVDLLLPGTARYVAPIILISVANLLHFLPLSNYTFSPLQFLLMFME